MKRFFIETLVWTVIAPPAILALRLLIDKVDFQWIWSISPDIYYHLLTLYSNYGSSNYVLLQTIFIIWVIGVIVILYRLIRRTIKYIEVLSDATEKIFDKNVEYIEMPDELDDVQKKINRLKRESESNERIAREAEQRKNDLVVYLAHDLKTPLTSVIGYLNLLKEEPDISEPLREKYTGIALDKAERLEDLINEFFEITRFNLSHLTLEYSRINLTLMLEQLTYEFKPILSEKNLICNLTAPEDLMIRCDIDKMQRVFDNLLRNAVNYSFENEAINIEVAENEGKVEISFTNKGNTIPEEKLERIFEQFYRLDSSRGTSKGGSGLGLAISKQIVELHHGTIKAESENEIIRISIELPVE